MGMRLRQVIDQMRGELRAVRQASKVSGGRDALIARARHDLDLEGVDSDRVAALESRLTALEADSLYVAEFDTRLAGTETRLTRIETQQSETHLRLTEAEAHIGAVEAQGGVTLDALGKFEMATHQHLLGIDRTAAASEFTARIDPVTTWVRSAQLTTTALISIVLPTYNRSELLRRAVESVVAQEYTYWELVIVDDGSADDIPALLSQLASLDERIVVVTQPHRGVGAARNSALSSATGDIICYLDDDNTMEPLWLKAVAWAFERQPGLELLYGARVMDVDESDDLNRTLFPTIRFEPFDRRRLEAANFIDLGVIAHLSTLPDVTFDESLEALGDWDLLLRMTDDRLPLPLPIVATIYTKSAPDRISSAGHFANSEAAVRARMLRQRPLRVLAYNSLFPLVTETYIADEMKALTDNGVLLAWCTKIWSPSPVKVVEPLYTDLGTAVREFEPDVLFLFWATFAVECLDELSRIGKPFGLRVHSFDFDLETIEHIRQHPLCIGIWAYPHLASQIEGVHDLVTLMTRGPKIPDPAPERSIVVSASAAVPKKDWPTLVAAFAELARKDVDCRIVVGMTHEMEELPGRIREMIRESGASIMMSIDVPNDQVMELLPRTAAVVYTKVPGGPFGMPRSIIEGMCAGTSVILPARPEASLVAGPNCRTYVDKNDIVRHVIEILGGGPDIDAEREFNRDFALTHFADPTLGTFFAAQLSRAVAEWRLG
jgi:glycosyltransferase involved in cell wall biosynthesis